MLILTVFALSIFLILQFSINDTHAYAVANTVNASWCSSAGFSWDSSTSTCTLTSDYTVNSGDTLEIPSGTTLVIVHSTIHGIFNSGTVSNHGTINLENTGGTGGITNSGGTFNNYGTINVQSTGLFGIISEFGPFNNFGLIVVENSGTGSTGIYNLVPMVNSGLIVVENSGTGNTGVKNSSTITDLNCGSVSVTGSGTITGNPDTPSGSGFTLVPGFTCFLTSTHIINSGDMLEIPSGATLDVYGGSSSLNVYPGATLQVDNGATLTIQTTGGIVNNELVNQGTTSNLGTINVENTGTSSTGIFNSGTTFSNSGTINVANAGSFSTGIINFDAISNSGSIVVENSGTGSIGVDNNIGSITNTCGGTITGTITGNAPVNDACSAPLVATADTYSVNENMALMVPAATGVLANDHDPDGDTLTASLTSSTTHGTLTINPDGSFTYTPNSDFVGSDNFVYQANDGHGSTASATVTITVNQIVCSVGTFLSSGSNTCTPAPPGSFVGTTGSTSASLCPVGTFTDLLGQSSCNPSPAGSFVGTTGATSATLCTPGSFQPLAGQSSCLPAQPGFFVNSTGAIQQTQCPAGTNSAAGATSCYVVDTTPPAISITQPSDGSVLNRLSSINGTASDDTSVSSVIVSIDGGLPAPATYSSGTWTLAATLSNGTHTVNATATDSVGLETKTGITHFTILTPTQGRITGGGHVGQDQNFGFEVKSDSDSKKITSGHIE
ncbi:MAG: cadherin-like domain-containing protein, partial [Thaumarchaeota archaeon]|nr:cadherin-like domain-containing protein [Nitrososphaerota archaeon]